MRYFYVWMLSVSVLLTVLPSTGWGQTVADLPIVLDTGSGKIDGSLRMPESASKGKVPVVLLIAGSGPTDRDGNSAGGKGSNNLKMLAGSLAQAGYASVRFDKRGIAASRAALTTESDIRFDSYVNDAADWLRMLKADPRFSDVGIAGHSEGSLIAILAAQKLAVKVVISIAGPAQNAADLLRQQLAGKLPPELAEKNEELLSSLQAGKTYAEVAPELLSLYRPSVQPYLISWFHYLPSQEIAKLSVPVLILQGDKDIQVSAAQAEALKKARPDAVLAIIPGMNHVLKIVGDDQAKQMASYRDPELPLAPALTDVLNTFLSQTMPLH